MPNGQDDPIYSYDEDEAIWWWKPDYEGVLTVRLWNDGGFIYHPAGQVPAGWLFAAGTPAVVSIMDEGLEYRGRHPGEWREYLEEVVDQWGSQMELGAGEYFCGWYSRDFVAFSTLNPLDEDDLPAHPMTAQEAAEFLDDDAEFAINLESGEVIVASHRPLADLASFYGFSAPAEPTIEPDGAIVAGDPQTETPLHLFIDAGIWPAELQTLLPAGRQALEGLNASEPGP
jgi:hypothetical protein